MKYGEKERERLLSLIAHKILDEGYSDQTLSGTARELGSNNRMLLYYFGSFENLVDEAIVYAYSQSPWMAAVRLCLEEPGDPLVRISAAWENLSHAENLPFLQLFFERLGVAIRTPEEHHLFLESIGGNDVWLSWLQSALREAVADDSARILSVSILALWRGLQLALISGTDPAVLNTAHRTALESMFSGVVASSKSE